MDADEEYYRDKWTMFGNEVETVEIDVIRNQHELRTRVDKMALRRQVEVKFWSHVTYDTASYSALCIQQYLYSQSHS